MGQKKVITAEEMVTKRKDILMAYMEENPDVIRKWEQMKEEYEVWKFRVAYRSKNNLFKDDAQLSLWPVRIEPTKEDDE